MIEKLLAVLLVWAASSNRTWQGLLQTLVDQVGIPKIVNAQMPAVLEMMETEFPNILPANRKRIAKAVLTRALQHIV